MELEDFITPEEENIEKIIANLLDEKNIELKTEIRNPLALTVLTLVGDYFGENGYNDTKDLIDKFVNRYLKYMVSFKRKSRQEVKDILMKMESEEETATDKLIKRLG